MTIFRKLTDFKCPDCFWEFKIVIMGETDRELFYCPACGKDSRKVNNKKEAKRRKVTNASS